MTLFHPPGSETCHRHPLHRLPCAMCVAEEQAREPYAAGASITCIDGKHELCGGRVAGTHRCPCPCHRGEAAPRVTWQSETERVNCQCRMSDAWRCAKVSPVPGRISCPCECHRYVQRQAALLDAAHPDGANGASPKS